MSKNDSKFWLGTALKISDESETKRKMSDLKKGEKNPSSKPIEFKGDKYCSIHECIKITGLTRYFIQKECVYI